MSALDSDEAERNELSLYLLMETAPQANNDSGASESDFSANHTPVPRTVIPRSYSPEEPPISSLEFAQIMGTFSSLQSTVMVTKCCASLFTRSSSNDDWTYQFVGLAVVVFTYKKSAPPYATLILAERGSGLALWTMPLVPLTSPLVYHRYLELSQPPMNECLATLTFPSLEGARHTALHINHATNLLHKISRVPGPLPSKIRKKIKPRDISSPCQVAHLTNLQAADWQTLHSMKTLVSHPTICNDAQLPE